MFVRCGLAGLGEHDLADVDISRQKSSLTVGEIIFPQSPEAVVETERDEVRPCGAEVISPGRERLGIILPENALANDGDAKTLTKQFENLRRRQHAAGKNVTLNEVDVAAVFLKQVILDGDCLDTGKSTWKQAIAQLREIARPEFFAYRLAHLDGGDAVILIALIAIVLQPDLDAIAEAGGLNASLGEVTLLLADGESDDLRADLGRIFSEATPSAADLEQLLPRLEVDRFGKPPVLVVLGRGQVGRVFFEQRRRIG